MELCKEYKSLECNERIDKIIESFDIDYQLNLPQYLEDIENLIKCEVKNVVSDYELSSNSIKVYGKSIISITYQTNGKCLLSNIFEEEFIKSFSLPEKDNYSFAKIFINTKYFNYHIVNQRRLDVHASVSACIEPFYKNCVSIMCECKNALTKCSELQMLSDKHTGYVKADFDEIFTINEKGSPIKNVISHSVSCVVDDTKLIKEKMLVKLTLTATVVYTDEGNKIQKCTYSFSLSKIIEISGCDETDNALVTADMSQIYIKPKADDNNYLCDIELVGKVVIGYVIVSSAQLCVISDSYIPHINTQLTKSEIKQKINPVYFLDDKSVELTFDNDKAVVEIVDLCCNITNCKIDNSSLSFTAVLNFLYYDESNELCFYYKSQDYSFALSDKMLSGDAAVNLKSFDYVIKSSDKLSVRLNIEYKAYLYEDMKISAISDIEETGDTEILSFPELTLYFARKDECVWDIAKSFSTDSRLIMEENNLNSDILETAKVLLVPGM